MKLLVLDNYDSFTYNLVHILTELGQEKNVSVIRNDKLSVDEAGEFDKILLSPGPGIPDEAGIMKEIIKRYGPTKSILGVCLGYQGIAEVYGASLFNLKEVLHGVTSDVSVVDPHERIFEQIPVKFRACHYHSWAVDPDTIGSDMVVTAVNTKGLVMGLRHSSYDVRGVQFHPEAILTEYGMEMIKNWLAID